MSEAISPSGVERQVDIDLEALREKYRQERDRRIRKDGIGQFVELVGEYRRYIEAGLVKEFGLNGCPIYFDLIGKKRDEARGSRGGVHASAEYKSEHETIED